MLQVVAQAGAARVPVPGQSCPSAFLALSLPLVHDLVHHAQELEDDVLAEVSFEIAGVASVPNSDGPANPMHSKELHRHRRHFRNRFGEAAKTADESAGHNPPMLGHMCRSTKLEDSSSCGKLHKATRLTLLMPSLHESGR